MSSTCILYGLGACHVGEARLASHFWVGQQLSKFRGAMHSVGVVLLGNPCKETAG